MEKIEYRLDEYRECEDGEWGPWQKLDAGWREDERVEPLPYQTNAEMIIDEHITGKIDDWKARRLLNRVLSRIREEIKFPAFMTIKSKIKSDRSEEIDRIRGYLEIIEKRILETEHPVESVERREKHKSTEIINKITNDDNYFLFDCHIDYLVEKGYLEIKNDCLIWKRGGSIMLAAYFGMLQEHHSPMKKHKWAPVEKVFKACIEGKLQPVRNLAQQYKDFEDVKKCKSNKHDEEYKELKALIENNMKNKSLIL